MADDEDVMEPDDEFEGGHEAPEPDEIDVDELDEDSLGEDIDEFDDADDEFADGEAVDEDATDGDEAATSGPVRRSVAGEDEDDDEDMLAPDDVEADLDTILKDRLVANDDEADADEEEETDDRADTTDRIQPKRADEELCPSCFLLVRNGAPGCPVGDDDCPLFT